MWGGDDPYTHLLCAGPTRCGKSATILTQICYQLLLQKRRGKKVGFSLIEPKGDLVRQVKEFCDVMEIPYIYIDPLSPDTHKFNVMEGDKEDVAEATVAVLQSLFGKQEAFFKTVQELSTRNVTKLLKEVRGDDLDLVDLLETLRDEKLLAKRVEELKRKNPNSDLIPFFENELLGSLKDQYRKLVIGLRAQLENITSNEKLRYIISGKSDINLDKHFEEGGVLLVNTALGDTKTSGDAFGMFTLMHLQSATFRRKGTERTRVPHFLIVDEFSRYINPDIEMFLSIAASYRVAGVFAVQSLGQLEVESGKISGKAMKQAILTSCRNKIAFCGLSAQDAKEFAEEFGRDIVIQRQSTYKNHLILPHFFPQNFRDTEIEEYRYHYTYLQDSMKRFHFICRMLKNGTPQRPFQGVGQFVPRDWKDRREWENPKRSKGDWTKKIFTGGNKVIYLFDSTLKKDVPRKKEEDEKPKETIEQEAKQLRLLEDNNMQISYNSMTEKEGEKNELETVSQEEKTVEMEVPFSTVDLKKTDLKSVEEKAVNEIKDVSSVTQSHSVSLSEQQTVENDLFEVRMEPVQEKETQMVLNEANQTNSFQNWASGMNLELNQVGNRQNLPESQERVTKEEQDNAIKKSDKTSSFYNVDDFF